MFVNLYETVLTLSNHGRARVLARRGGIQIQDVEYQAAIGCAQMEQGKTRDSRTTVGS